MKDDQLLHEVGRWLHDADPAPPDAHEHVRQAMARTPQVRQRGRWWPLPVLRRTTYPPTVDRTITSQPNVHPSSNRHTLTVLGGSHSMFSATKLVVAGAIVALFSGFLLAGVLTPATEQAPGSTYEATLDALVTETVAPGIRRVIGDDAGMDGAFIHEATRIAFGVDGSAWITSSDGAGSRRLRRIGHEGGMGMPDLRDIITMDTGPDGRLWVAGLGGLATFDGQSWSEDSGTVRAFVVMPDGNPWALRNGQVVGGLRVAPMVLGGFAIEDAPGMWPDALEAPADRPIDLAVTADGAVWVGVQQGTSGWLARSDGDEWVLQEPPGIETPFGVHALASGRDGALWALLMTAVPTSVEDDGRSCCEPILARFDEDGWTTWHMEDGLPLTRSYIWSAVGGVATLENPGTPLAVAPDGTLWMGDLARGVISFDGTTFTTYATGEPGAWGQGHATEIAFAPDGTTWAVVVKEEGAGLFIIDPGLARSEPVAVEPTEQAEPTDATRALDPLPGVDLVAEEVEPGVQRLTADGFGRSLRGLLAVERAAAGPTWLLNSDGGRAFRLDTGGATKFNVRQRRPLVSSTSDGSLAVLVGREAYVVAPAASDASGASEPPVAVSIAPALPSRVRTPTALAGAADGSVWASWTEGDGMNAGDTRVLRYLAGEWQDHSGADELGGLIDLESTGNYVCDITATTDGAVYVGVCGAGGGGFGDGGLFRHHEGRWERVRVFAEMGRTDILVSDQGPLVSGPDGTLWAATWTTTPQIAEAAAAGDWSVVDELAAGSEGLPLLGPALLRLRDGRWSAYAWHDLEPDNEWIPWLWDASDALAVDADGVLWFGSAGGSARPEVMIGSFDGEEVRWYPEVADARDLEIGPDGHPWIAAADGIYVIDPAEVQRDFDEPGPE